MNGTLPLLGSHAFRGLRIGILGGSFNPAHEGHLHISLLALKKLRLHAVWWLVSPQNPLKSEQGMAPFAERLKGAQRMAKPHPQIIVTDIEARLGTRFTADTLQKLRARFPATRFVWLMGADNLVQIPRWQRWESIFKMVDIAVFRRPPYFVSAFHGLAATRFAKSRLDARKARLLGTAPKTQWILFNNRLHTASATRIRQSSEK
ncbi:MAG TPA: nicotinate-nucleotide adenylyltransferase [Alphaproteobacteria bacterium]|nr:nicotinate-nucleotide adenylyltransferase [Alphaproteobacteria bacterium]